MEQSASWNNNLSSNYPLTAGSVKPLEAAYLETVQEWKKACVHLASSVDTYLNACLTLGTACLDSLDTFETPSLLLQTLDAIDKEKHRMESDWPKLCRARAAICAARNRSPKIAPINTLPHEILAHIFNLVVTSEFWHGSPVDAYDSTTDDQIELPKYPDNLSKVCSFWHQLVDNTPTLWSRIHLVVSGPSKDPFFARASHLVKRAANTPLFIYIHDPQGFSRDADQLTSWLAPVVSKIHYLETTRRSVTLETLHLVLGCWFEHGTPGTLKELSLRGAAYDWPRFVELVSEPSPEPLQFNISSERFADFLRPVTLLRLSGVFPPWNSQAFCGLEHLRLTKGSITEAQFVAVLSENHRLRTLTFGLKITEAQPRGALQTPVHLSELEVLNIDAVLMRVPATIWSVLRLLAPGTQPLRMALKVGKPTQFHKFMGTEEVQAFFQRSNVTTCYLDANYDPGNPWFSTMMRELPHLRALCVTNRPIFEKLLSHEPGYDGIDCVCPRLHELTMIKYSFALDDFKKMLRAHSIQVLRLQDCKVFSRGEGSRVKTGDLEEELSELVPNVKTYDGEDGDSDPYLNWDYTQF